jgi:hypothetical protein
MSVSLRNDSYSVTCDRCHDRPLAHTMLTGEFLCHKCHGDGRILIQPERRTTSQTAVREMAWILFGAALVGAAIFALLRWFGLI